MCILSPLTTSMVLLLEGSTYNLEKFRIHKILTSMNLSPLIPPYAVQTRPLKKDAIDNPMGILTTLFVLITFLYYKHKKQMIIIRLKQHV